MDASQRPAEDFERETARLRRIARGIVFEPALADDVVQEAWLAALRAQRSEALGGGWLTEAVRRIALGLRRSEGRRTTRERRAASAKNAPSAADAAARLELLQELLAALASLEEPYRTAAQLRLVDDLSPREIARQTEVPVETARTRIRRGMERLRAQLDQSHSNRREEFLGLIAPLAGIGSWNGAFGTWAGSKTLGGAFMGAKTKVVLIVALLAAAGVWWARPWDSAHSERTPGTLADASVVSAEELARTSASASAEPVLMPSDVREPGAARTLLADKTPWVLRGRALLGRDKPFAGGEVRLRVVLGYEAPGELLHDELVHAGIDGGFELALPAPEGAARVLFQAQQAGYLGFPEEVLVLRGAPVPADLVARFYPLDVVLRGRVIDPEARPVRGARVEGLRTAVETDAEGRFETRASTHLHEARLWASAKGFARVNSVVAVDTPGVIEGLEIQLGPGCTLRGRVLDESGRAVAGAVISDFLEDEVDATSGEDGRFVLDGLPRKESWISIQVRAEGYARLRHDFQDGRVPEGELELRLRRGVEIRGQVRDESGQPLPGAMVYSSDERWNVEAVRAIATDEGRYVLRDVRREEQRLGAEHEGLAPYEARVELPQQAPLSFEHDIVLKAGLAARGLVVDELGQPLENIQLAAQRDRSYLGNLGTHTDASGRFELRGLPPGPGVGLELYASGFVRRELPIDPGAGVELRIEMQRCAGYVGRVVDGASGEPITAFRVRFVPAALAQGDVALTGYSATWSADGGVQFHDPNGRWDTAHEELEAGQVTGIEVTAAGYGPGIVAHAVAVRSPASQPIVIALGPARAVRGVVVDARDGHAVAGVVVRRFTPRDPVGPWEARGEHVRLEALTDARGEFAFEGLPAEPMSLYVEALGFAPASDGPFEPLVEATARRIELHGGASLRGVLRDAAGTALANEGIGIAAFSVAGQQHRDWELTTDAEGRFALAGLAPGTYQASRLLRYERGAMWDLTRMVEVAAERENEVELRPRGHTRLVVRLGAGVVATGVMTVLAEPVRGPAGDGRSWRAAVARDGKLEIDGLEEGTWEVRLSDERRTSGGLRSGSTEVVIPAGTGTIEVEIALR